MTTKHDVDLSSLLNSPDVAANFAAFLKTFDRPANVMPFPSPKIVETGDRLAYPVSEACRMLGIGRTFLYMLEKRGAVRFVKLGRRTMVPRSEIDRLLAEGTEQPKSDQAA